MAPNCRVCIITLRYYYICTCKRKPLDFAGGSNSLVNWRLSSLVPGGCLASPTWFFDTNQKQGTLGPQYDPGEHDQKSKPAPKLAKNITPLALQILARISPVAYDELKKMSHSIDLRHLQIRGELT